MLADRDRKLDPTRDTGRGGRHVSTGKILSAGCDQVWDQDVECRKLSQQRLRIYVQKNIMIVTHNLRLCKHVSASVFQLHLPRSSILARAANEPSAKLYNFADGSFAALILAAVLLQTADTRRHLQRWKWLSLLRLVSIVIIPNNLFNYLISHHDDITELFLSLSDVWRIVSTSPINISTNYASTPVTAR